ncbi:zinc-binding alcohol dehydrogenase family protein [Ktedonosporobacter rubrisoli]|uniref:Zinc-type alcohol dehydrogenase-like protein n=1 Tax=Ktedonosporobacter rubrisoli TaxID=2509675 RepID=A0A4P6JV31_KTERU|nr:zinc-binding alcohol dehydrogenase family protein [Ktedonosporobacter rubrisoli]QBD79518.1 zinc-binding alcohol dehydrogenase family protein [Ktedonosporobacter rubrisoli]
MKAIQLSPSHSLDIPNSFSDVEIQDPTPGSRDLLVRVKAISINPVDTQVREAMPRTESVPLILGWDVAGVVEAVGSQCNLFRPGDAVYYAGDWKRPGAYSELHVVDERLVGAKPQLLDFAQAAALPLTTITAWEGLFERLLIPLDPQANRGKSILLINAAGGVGSIATQLAHWAGLTVIGTASRSTSIQWVKEHGAAYAVNHHYPLASQLQQLGFTTVDYIFCLKNTASYWEAMAEVIAPQGKIGLIDRTEQLLDLTALQSKSVTVAWEGMFTRSEFQTADMQKQHDLLNRVAELIDAKVIRTTLTERLSPITASNVLEAHRKVKQGSLIGKLVLEHFPPSTSK